MAILFLLGRILFGGYFVMSGFNHFRNLEMLSQYAASKGVSAPRAAVRLTGLMLLLGGLGILLGVKIGWAVLLLSVFLIVVSFKMHNFWTISDPMAKMPEMINFLKNMALLGAALMMLMIPAPWVYSIGW